MKPPPKSKVKNLNRNPISTFLPTIITLFKLSFSDYTWQCILATIIRNGLFLSSDFISWQFYQVNADFAVALSTYDYELFYAALVSGLKCAALLGIVGTAYDFVTSICGIMYRRNAIGQAHKKYFRYATYYRLNCIDNMNVDNPDQRITNDISNCSEMCVNNLTPLFTSYFISMIIFSYKNYQKSGWEGIAIVYSAVCIITLTNFIFVKPIGKWTNRIEKSEGWFRYKHCTIRDNAESAAMYDASKFENKECMRLIDQIMMKNLWLGCWELAQQFMQAFFLGLQVVMCYTILFFPIIVHNNDIKDILAFITLNFSECHFLYMTIYYRYVCTIQDFFNSAGTLRRVHEFLEFADNNWKEVADDEAEIDKRVKFCSDGNEVFKFDSVCYETPISPSKVLMTDLNFTLKKGENLLVSGYSGSGKSAFLRIITRLWKIKSGTFTMGISDNEILVIPQKPYFPTGNLTLRQQIIFPKLIDDRNVSDKVMLEFINNLQLTMVLEKCGGLNTPVDFEWHERFTPAELQQISFMRVLYHQPKLVLMDDVSSCCSAAVEQRLYELLDGLGISYISAGNRVSLRAFHHKELKLRGDGTYEVVDLRDDPFV